MDLLNEMKLYDLGIINENVDIYKKGTYTRAKRKRSKIHRRKFITKNVDGIIIFLEKGSTKSGLEHILSRHWKEGELMRFFTSQSEMIENIYIYTTYLKINTLKK